MKWMNKILITCKKATFLSANRRLRPMSWKDHLQLKLHLAVCKACNEFDKQSREIDVSINKLYPADKLSSVTTLSAEKKTQIKDTVNQRIKNKR